MSYPAPFEERQAAWDKWYGENRAVIESILAGVDAVMPGQED
jgi:hypothetical protein